MVNGKMEEQGFLAARLQVKKIIYQLALFNSNC